MYKWLDDAHMKYLKKGKSDGLIKKVPQSQVGYLDDGHSIN